MSEERPPAICPMCQSAVKEKSGISRKTNKPYRFYGCSNYPECDYIFRPPITALPKETSNQQIRDIEILDKLKKLYDILVIIDGKIKKIEKYLEKD